MACSGCTPRPSGTLSVASRTTFPGGVALLHRISRATPAPRRRERLFGARPRLEKREQQPQQRQHAGAGQHERDGNRGCRPAVAPPEEQAAGDGYNAEAASGQLALRPAAVAVRFVLWLSAPPDPIRHLLTMRGGRRWQAGQAW